jgi:hypothetical protein
VADCLVTDYSNSIYDFISTGRQIVLFNQEADLEQLCSELYTPLEQMPFPLLHSARGLAAYLIEAQAFHPSEEYLRFAERFASPIGQQSAAALIDTVLGSREVLGRVRVPTAVDVVFVPYLKKSGRAVFEGLLASGFDRDDVVFVMSGHRYRSPAGAYLHDLYAERGVKINYRVTTDRMLLTPVAAAMSWASRRFGWRFAALDRVYLQEARRVFGTTYVRSATDVSGYDKFSAMARVIDEHADGGPL